MKVNNKKIEQSAITAVITLIVAAVGYAMFNASVALYSGITAGLSVTVGKEYGDSLVMEDNWHVGDIIPAIVGVAAGLLMCIMLYWFAS